MALEDLIREYFEKPAMGHGGYNAVNTLVYAVILLAVSFKIIYPQLDKRGVKFNTKLMLALLPFILFGSSARVLEDMGLLPRSFSPLEFGYYTYTPGIYIAVGLLTIASLFIARALSVKTGISFYKILGSIGLVLALPVVGFEALRFRALEGFVGIVLGAAALTGVVCVAVRSLWWKSFFENKLNVLAVAGQALDGVATFVALQFYRCGEQHVLSRAVIDVGGPLAFPIVKMFLIALILFYVEKEVKEKNLNNFIKVFIIILGFATGTRDLFTVGVGTCL